MCSNSLGTNLLPTRCFEDMLNAVVPGGHIVFTVSDKHLQEESMFGTDYLQAIKRLQKQGAWELILRRNERIKPINAFFDQRGSE